MRDYGTVSPKFWTGDTGKKLRADPDAQRLAFYLMTSPHAISTGVYQCPVMYMAHEIGLSPEGATKALARLIEAKFCEFDEASEWVFVHNMARWQIGESVKPEDRRHKWLLREVQSMPKCLKTKFLAMYGAAYELPQDEPEPSPLQAPSKPLRSQDHDQDHRQDQEQEHVHDQRARGSVPRESGGLSQDFGDFAMANYPPCSGRRSWQVALHNAHVCVVEGKATEADLRRRLTDYRAFMLAGGHSTAYTPQNWFDHLAEDPPCLKEWPLPTKRGTSTAARANWHPDNDATGTA